MAYLCAFAVAGRSLERANAAACAPGEAEGAEKEGRLRGSQTLPWLVARRGQKHHHQPPLAPIGRTVFVPTYSVAGMRRCPPPNMARIGPLASEAVARSASGHRLRRKSTLRACSTAGLSMSSANPGPLRPNAPSLLQPVLCFTRVPRWREALASDQGAF